MKDFQFSSNVYQHLQQHKILILMHLGNLMMHKRSSKHKQPSNKKPKA